MGAGLRGVEGEVSAWIVIVVVGLWCVFEFGREP